MEESWKFNDYNITPEVNKTIKDEFQNIVNYCIKNLKLENNIIQLYNVSNTRNNNLNYFSPCEINTTSRTKV